MPEKKERKKFKDTKVGKFLAKNGPKILDVVDDYCPPLKVLTAIITNDKDLSEEDKKTALELMKEEMEYFKLEQEDRQDARKREVEYIKATGHIDWIMFATAVIGLGAFVTMVIAIIFYPEKTKDNPLFVHLMGIIEGVAFMIFQYYWGSSRGSAQKTAALERMAVERSNDGK